MSKENKLAPDLRFPEFRDRNDWETKRLSEVLTEHGLKSSGKEEVHSVSVNKGIVNQIEHLGRSYSAASTDNYKLVKPGDVIYTKSPTGDFPYGIVKQSKLDKNVIVSPLYGVFSPETPDLGYILDSYFESPRNTIKYLDSIIQKGAKNTINITNDKFLSKTILVPSNPDEQKKIAECIISISKIIKLQLSKLDALKEQKKGMMRILFPLENQDVPKYRFDEFEINEKWEQKKFNKLFTRLKSKNHENNKNVLTISAQKGLISQQDFFNREIAGKDLTGYYILHKGDFAYNKSYSQGYPVGATKVLKDYEKGVVSTLYICFKSNNIQDISFFEHYFESGYLNKQLSEISQEGARNHGLLNIAITDYFDKLHFMVPVNPLERQRIAKCLSSFDVLIKNQNEYVDYLKLHKKALIQQLFPQPNHD